MNCPYCGAWMRLVSACWGGGPAGGNSHKVFQCESCPHRQEETRTWEIDPPEDWTKRLDSPRAA